MKLNERLENEFRGDRSLWFVLLCLSLISLLAIYSASGVMAASRGVSTEYYLFKQTAFLLASLFFAYICHRLNYRFYSSIAFKLLLVSGVLLVYTLFFGESYNGSRRWINLGFSFQPSDIAEVALIIYLAKVISSRQESIKQDKNVFLALILPVIFICGLILPTNLSSAALLFSTSILIMFIGRIPIKYIGYLILIGIVVFLLVLAMGYVFPDIARSHTWTSRFDSFMSGNESFQSQQSKIAIANGGFLGLGPHNSMQKSFLPYAYADFIFAIICEEYGLWGPILVLALYLILLFRCIRLVTLSPKTFGAILAVGLSLNLIVQAFANILVTIGLLPVTGVTLPIISLGGTTTVFTFISFGIILSVSKYIENFKETNSVIIQNHKNE